MNENEADRQLFKCAVVVYLNVDCSQYKKTVKFVLNNVTNTGQTVELTACLSIAASFTFKDLYFLS